MGDVDRVTWNSTVLRGTEYSLEFQIKKPTIKTFACIVVKLLYFY